MAKDLYSVLGVAKGAEQDAIKKAYRKLASKLHPDKNPGKRNEARFKEVNSAFDVLGDPKKRALYDEFGEESLSGNFDAERARAFRNFQRQGGRGGMGGGVNPGDFFGGGGGGGGADLGDLLGDLFGGGGGGRGRPRGGMRGQDLESTVALDFVSAIQGTQLTLQARGHSKPVTVRVPPGARDGGRLRIPGHGGPGMGSGPPGDLLLTMQVKPHQYFTRDGDDLHLDLPITLGEAAKGAKVAVPTPTGEVSLKVPHGTQSGQVARLKGKGVHPRGKKAGDLYVKFLVRYPVGDEPELMQAIEVLDARGENPRQGIAF